MTDYTFTDSLARPRVDTTVASAQGIAVSTNGLGMFPVAATAPSAALPTPNKGAATGDPAWRPV
jgi:hypothetical protein